MSDFSEPISPEQFVSNQVRKITTLSLEERSGEALKLALELLDQYGEYPLVHRCIAKVYQRMDQTEVALKHHDLADQLSEAFFKKSNPLIVPIRPDSSDIEKDPSPVFSDTLEIQKEEPKEELKKEPSPKKKELSALALSQKFDEKELNQLREQLLETTRNDVLKAAIEDVEHIPVIKLSKNSLFPKETAIVLQPQPVLQQANPLAPPIQGELKSFTEARPEEKYSEMFPWIPRNLTLKQAICLFRETYVQQVFLENQKDIDKTARILGISRENLEFLLGI